MFKNCGQEVLVWNNSNSIKELYSFEDIYHRQPYGVTEIAFCRNPSATYEVECIAHFVPGLPCKRVVMNTPRITSGTG